MRSSTFNHHLFATTLNVISFVLLHVNSGNCMHYVVYKTLTIYGSKLKYDNHVQKMMDIAIYSFMYLNMFVFLFWLISLIGEIYHNIAISIRISFLINI